MHRYLNSNHPPHQHRQLLIFKHNPKAGGGSILGFLLGIKPNRLWKEYDTDNRQGLTQDFYKIWNHANPEDSFVTITESEAVTMEDSKYGFVISSIREPCSHYLSQWAFGSTKRGGCYQKIEQNMGQEFLEQAYGHDEPTFDSDDDINRFREVWLKSDAVRGNLAERFHEQFGFQYDNNTSSSLQPPATVDCWIFVESIHESLLSCLEQFSSQGGTIDWTHPYMKELIKVVAAENSTRKLIYKSKDDLRGNPQKHHHAPCSAYFNDETKALLENGPESFIYQMFGYKGCCDIGRIAAMEESTQQGFEDVDEEDDVEEMETERYLVNSISSIDDNRNRMDPSMSLLSQMVEDGVSEKVVEDWTSMMNTYAFIIVVVVVGFATLIRKSSLLKRKKETSLEVSDV